MDELRKRASKYPRVGVLYGGWGGERPISLASGRNVLEGLRAAGMHALPLEVTPRDRDLARLRRRIRAARMDAAFNIIHGVFGEDGGMQSLLDSLGIPYPGSGAVSSALAMQKAYSKLLFEEKGIPTAPWQALDRGTPPSRRTAEVRVPLPLVVKPADSGSALGVTIVRKRSGLGRALASALRESRWALVERFIPGVEITVGVLDGRALPVTEIVPKNEFYDLDAKYTPGKSVHITPARLKPAVRREAQRIALEAGAVLGCRDFYRVDLIVPRAGVPQVLEVNTLPGMTDTSLYPEAAKAAGIGFPRLLRHLVMTALRRQKRNG
jgi:D-alanine-D-alanine ligase